jgi:hypothetical protein
MRKQKGRKAFILLSDGADFRSKASLGTAIEYAQRADTIIYSILFVEPLRPYRALRSTVLAICRGRGRKVMRRLATETGGAFFEVTKDEPIEKIYSKSRRPCAINIVSGTSPNERALAGSTTRSS